MQHMGRVEEPAFYTPWIGANYEKQLKQALARSKPQPGAIPLVHFMGESHYIEDGLEAYENSPHLTRQIVCDWAMKRSQGGRFFTKIAQAIQNRPASDVDRSAAWADIAYSNFVQQPLSGPRRAPNGEMWADARRRFFGQLASTRPTVLVVLGQRTWAALPADVGAPVSSDLLRETGAGAIETWIYPYEVDGVLEQALAIRAAHPSGSRYDWRIVARHIDWAGQNFRLIHPRY